MAPGEDQTQSDVDADVDADAAPSPYLDWRAELGFQMDRYFGRSVVYPDVETSPVPVDVRVYEPTESSPWHRLVTCGVSASALPSASDPGTLRHMEFLLYLPTNWSFDFQRWGEAAFWPMRLLGTLSRFAHTTRTAFDIGDTVAFSDPPEPFVAGTLLTSAALLPPMLEREGFRGFRIGAKKVEFMGVMPLTPEEVTVKQAKGLTRLLRTLDEGGAHPVIDPRRQCTVTGRWPEG